MNSKIKPSALAKIRGKGPHDRVRLILHFSHASLSHEERSFLDTMGVTDWYLSGFWGAATVDVDRLEAVAEVGAISEIA